MDESLAFDKIMELVGNDGKFQKRYNIIFNFILCMLIPMAFENYLLIVNEPDHWCHVTGRETTNFTIEEWRDRVLPLYVSESHFMSPNKLEFLNSGSCYSTSFFLLCESLNMCVSFSVLHIFN